MRCKTIMSVSILKMYNESFKINYYTSYPFRVIGLIDVDIKFSYGIEKVTLAFFRSSGTNDNKIKGLWYPIAGIKMHSGDFHEFTPDINDIFFRTTSNGQAPKGWLAKSLFFKNTENKKVRGFSRGRHYEKLLNIGKTLSKLYENGDYLLVSNLNLKKYNSKIYTKKIYQGNKHSQKYNFESFIKDIFEESKNM